MALQELLGEKGLSLNDSKTVLGKVDDIDVPQQVDAMKRDLLRIRRQTIEVSGEEAEVETVVHVPIGAEQLEYLLDLLESPDIEESDAELVVSFFFATTQVRSCRGWSTSSRSIRG